LNTNIRLLWQGQLVSQLGSQAYSIAMMFWLMEMTGSSGVMSLILIMTILPSVLIGPFAGVVADRYCRKKIIVITDVIRGFMVLPVAAMMYADVQNTAVAITIFGFTGMICGCCHAFFSAAIQASIPDFAGPDKLMKTNALFQSTSQVTGILGQALGGILFRVLGAPLLILLDALSFLLSAISESFIKMPVKDGGAKKVIHKAGFGGYKSSIIEGFDFVKGVPGMLATIFFAAGINFFAAQVMVMLPFYVAGQLALDAHWYGFLLASMGVGTVLGSVFVAQLKIKPAHRASVIILSMFMLASGYVLLGNSFIGWWSLLCMILVGICIGVFNLTTLTLLQTITPSEFRGRVMSLMMSFSGLSLPLGLAVAGVFGEVSNNNTQLIFTVSGLSLIGVTLVAAFSRKIKQFWRL
jgi:DHA3 family macrolide efflux protein-like MFS transporter